MKKEILFFLLLTHFSFLVNAQLDADLSIEIVSPPHNQQYDFYDPITISYKLKNNGPNPIDLIEDSVTKVGVYSSLDSTFKDINGISNKVIHSRDSFILGVDEEIVLDTRTMRRTQDILDVFSTPFTPGDMPLVFRDHVRDGVYVIFAQLFGLGSGFLSTDWEESDIYNDPVDSNNISYVVITIGKPFSVNDLSTCNLSITTYPNPAIDKVNFDYEFIGTEKLLVTVTDLTGKSIIRSEFQGNSKQQCSIDIRSLNPGMYLLSLQSESGYMQTKFVVGN